MTCERKGLLLLLSGPSGTGKSALASRLLDRHGGPGRRLERSVSVTTRPARPGEVDGRDYFFVDDERFASFVAQGAFLEHTEIYGCRYGTHRAFVEQRLSRGIDILLVLDAAGRAGLAATHAADLVSVFLLPPSRQELERRIRDRRQDDESSIARRLAAAGDEIAQADEFDYMLVNHDLEDTLAALGTILAAERLRRRRLQLPTGWSFAHTPRP